MKFSIFGASIQGYSHSHHHNHCPNQDAIFGKTYIVNNDDKPSKISIIALADGIGSENLAEYGSRATVKIAADYVAKHFYQMINSDVYDFTIKLTIILQVKSELKLYANRINTDIRSLASTLLLVASDGINFLTFSCGDSVICHHLSNGDYKVTSPTYVSFTHDHATIGVINAESFLDQVHVIRGKLVTEKKKIDAFFLMSDGIAPLFVKIRKNPDKGCDKVFTPDNFDAICSDVGVNTEREMSEELERQFEEIRSEKFYDDMSLIAMVDTEFNKKQDSILNV